MIFPIKVTQPSYSKPTVTALLSGAQMVDPYSLHHFMTLYSLRPAYFHFSNVFTSMFVHANWIHVIGNMVFLWVFGDNVEDILGHGKYLLFYLLCGMAAAMAQMALDPSSRVPMVGASGAIAGVMGAYLVKFPKSRVVMLFWFFFFFTFDLPAWFMLVYWFGLQFAGGLGSIAEATQGGTAFFAHLGGFVAGIVLVYTMGTRQPYWRRRDLQW
jgi:membrane associated rhomboid family serine protease